MSPGAGMRLGAGPEAGAGRGTGYRAQARLGAGRGFGPSGRTGRGLDAERGPSGGTTRPTSPAPPPGRLDMVAATYRSVYLPRARNETPRALDVFDTADSNAIVARRVTSNTADQALYLLNNPFVLAQSRAFAGRLTRQATSRADQIKLAFRLAYGRSPQASEIRAATAFLKDMQPAGKGLELLCQSLFASAEFRYVY